MNVNGDYSAAQRINTLTSSVDLTNLLVTMLTIAFKKGKYILSVYINCLALDGYIPCIIES